MAKKKRRSRKAKKKSTLTTFLFGLFFNSKSLPLLLTTVTLAILFVVFRMRGVEQDYKNNTVQKNLERITLEGKELKAQKARMLSIKNLRDIAKKYNLNTPSDKQLIVIPK